MDIRTPYCMQTVSIQNLSDCASNITDKEDREEEETHIKNALTHCQYPRWAIEKRKTASQKKRKQAGRKNKKYSRNRDHGHGYTTIHPGSHRMHPESRKVSLVL